MTQPMIDVQHLSFSYEADTPVLSDVSFCIHSGEAVGLVGANGVGKSTLLKLLVGLDLSFSGHIQVDGISLSKRALPAVREKIGYVFQDADSQLFLSTVSDDLAFAPRNYALPQSEVAQRVEQALQQVGIEHLREKPIYHLSGGEKKLVSIATILTMTPKVILMDEPSIALDPKNRRRLIGLLHTLSPLKIIASHDLDLILDTCPRTILMDRGTIVRDGPTDEILTDQGLLESCGLELPLGLQGVRRKMLTIEEK